MSTNTILALGALGWALIMLGCLILSRRVDRNRKDFE